MIAMRWSGREDCECLAELHRDAWRNAYAGIIPGPALERMIALRGPRWWRRMHRLGAAALLIETGDITAGYATLGPARRRVRGGSGEIYEIYLRPECQGIGLGGRLFREARQRLRAAGLPRLTVWALADNQIACRFYRAVGGREVARTCDCIGGVPLDKIGFAWA